MSATRDQFKSSFGAFSARERELERARARRDARDAVPPGDAGTTPAHPGDASPPRPTRP